MIQNIVLLILFFPLLGSALVGIFGKYLRALPSQLLTILLVGISLVLSAVLFNQMVFMNHAPIDHNLYAWAISNTFTLNIGLMIDRLSAMMALVVCFVSFLVHIYSIGYMAEDPHKQRFFSYISLFTFMMLVLVFANNFLLLFFGWEGVGLMSYLLIGFWFDKPLANDASLKAFYVNRVGDFAFLIGIAGVFAFCHSLNYADVFPMGQQLLHTTFSVYPGYSCSLLTLLCLLIFVGAMGKSAQMPLHVWLPESMEGPTPISALIHAATMVTAGIFLLARLSPLYQLSSAALSFVLVIGSTGALFMGILGIVQTDIKKVVAYSTLSQLGYMMAAAGASDYAGGMFHLFMHACFKALLFLAAGSVIVALHEERDMRKMGALAKKMPITYICFLCGALALIALPPTSGFYSKDSIIETVQHLNGAAGAYAYWCLLLGVFFTALYTFRCFFLVFHTDPREAHPEAIRETSSVMWLPLLCLAVPSLALGYFCVHPLLSDMPSWFGNTIVYSPKHLPSSLEMAMHSVKTAPFWLMIAGVFVAWLSYIRKPKIPALAANRSGWLYTALVEKYGFDAFYQMVFVNGTKRLANFLFLVVDVKWIDADVVNGLGRFIEKLSGLGRKLQSGYLYEYIFIMILGFLLLLVWQVF